MAVHGVAEVGCFLATAVPFDAAAPLDLWRSAHFPFQPTPGGDAHAVQFEVVARLLRIGGIDPGEGIFRRARARLMLLNQRYGDTRPARQMPGKGRTDDSATGDNDFPHSPMLSKRY